jgi:hypothetical protein
MATQHTVNPEQEYYKTYVVKGRQDARINDIAWWERKDKKDVIQEALDFYLEHKKEVPCKPSKAA